MRRGVLATQNWHAGRGMPNVVDTHLAAGGAMRNVEDKRDVPRGKGSSSGKSGLFPAHPFKVQTATDTRTAQHSKQQQHSTAAGRWGVFDRRFRQKVRGLE